MENFNHKRYRDYTVSDFVLDEDFIQWVKTGEKESGRIWSAWKKQYPEKIPDLNIAKSIVRTLEFNDILISQKETQEAWEAQEKNHHRTYPLSSVKSASGGLRMFIRMAAVLLLIATFIFIARHFTSAPQLQVSEVPYLIVKENPRGQKLQVVLPDGTEIKLNSDSRLEYPSLFTGDTREVVLWGEAFFDVVHDPAHPFVIRTGSVSTTVLGTRFNIHAYPEYQEVDVALVEGKVRVESRNETDNTTKEIELEPFQMATIYARGNSVQVSKFDEEEVTGWKDGILFMEKVDFKKAVTQLERWYGVTFRIAQKERIDLQWRFSGKFKNRSLEYVLDALRYPELFEFEIDDKTVTIK